MNEFELACGAQLRRAALLGQRDSYNGIDFVEVSDDQLSLCVHFFGDVPALADREHPAGLTIANLRIGGGTRIRDIAILGVRIDKSGDDQHDDCLRITLSRPGDFSVYRLCMVKLDGTPYTGFDPRFHCAGFSFKVNCPSDLDCREQGTCAPVTRPAPEINYLAKDYASFRQLILDRMALTMPDWQERHAPDLGITLVELLAYAGDHLSYYQDAVATEAYLDTARQRISVRRHARLVDYLMHEGLNARAWVSVHTTLDTPPLDRADFFFITAVPGLKTTGGRLVDVNDLRDIPPSRYEVFEPVADGQVQFIAANSQIDFYTWGDAECCLPRGATRATLVNRDRALRLHKGQVLIFEEVLGPHTGSPADADPAHRHAVRITSLEEASDPLLDADALVEIGWAAADALPFALCLSARLAAPDCRRIGHVSVARGNVLLVDHGRAVHGEDAGTVGSRGAVGECACEGSLVDSTERPAPLHVTLRQAPLTFADPLSAPIAAGAAALAFVRDARLGQPQVTLTGTQKDAGPDHPPDPRRQWVARPDLLSSFPEQQHFVAEMDDAGYAHLRFGDGDAGRMPPAGMAFSANYRIGNGPAGNVGRDAISCLVLHGAMWSGPVVNPRNPMAASGGVAPEPVAEVKLFAPFAFRNQIRRAVTADDYAAIAGADKSLQRAAARMRWNGSWYEAQVAIDPLAACQDDAALPEAVARRLYPHRRIGHDLRVVRAGYVALDIELTVCVADHFARGAVRAELLGLFGNAGLFHPDQLTFGGAIYVSKLVAAAQAVDGVDHVEVTRLKRLHRRPAGGPVPALLPVGEMEIAQMDNDPNYPERGLLKLIMRGGR